MTFEQRARDLIEFGQEIVDAHPSNVGDITRPVERQFYELYSKFSSQLSRLRRGETTPAQLQSPEMQRLDQIHDTLRERYQEYRGSVREGGRRTKKTRRGVNKKKTLRLRKRTSRR